MNMFKKLLTVFLSVVLTLALLIAAEYVYKVHYQPWLAKRQVNAYLEELDNVFGF